MEGSVFYFDIYQLLIKIVEPKTRFNLIRTCKRFWNMFDTLEKKSWYIGFEKLLPCNFLLEIICCHSCGLKHLKGSFVNIKCEKCQRCIDMCPSKKIARCLYHKLHDCNVCKEKNVEQEHRCKLIEHQLEFVHKNKYIKVKENVYLDEKNKIYFIHVKDEYSIPNLLQYNNCYVFKNVNEYFMKYEKTKGIITKIDAMYCKNCGTSKIKKKSGNFYYCNNC